MTTHVAAIPAPSGWRALVHPGRPSDDVLAQLLAEAADAELSYDDVGATLGDTIPHGFRTSGREDRLGSGHAAWSAARAALDRWTMFSMPWVRMPTPEPPHVGQNVVFASSQFGFWSLHSCRVVRVIDEPTRYGFAYGTLATHAIRGEELFLLQRDGDDVTFRIRKFAQPNHPIVRLAQPLSVWMQGRFDRDAIAAMRAAVEAT